MHAHGTITIHAAYILAFALGVASCGETAGQPANAPGASSDADVIPGEGVRDEPPPEVDDELATDQEGTDPGDDEAEASGEDRDVGVSLKSSRDKDELRAVVDANQEPVQACYRQALKRAPKLRGMMVVTVEIDPEGAVTSAVLDEGLSQVTDAELAKCAVDFIRTVKFPASPKGMITTYHHPFKFKPPKNKP